jgi:hypothetical protein
VDARLLVLPLLNSVSILIMEVYYAGLPWLGVGLALLL